MSRGANHAHDGEGMALAKNPELECINRYFAGRNAPHRFDGFGRSNDHRADYFDPKVHPAHLRTRACVSVEWVAFSETAQDAHMIYVPCGISSGLRPHELLDKMNRSNRDKPHYEPAVSTYKAEEHLGAKAHHDDSIAPNRRDNLIRGGILGCMRPDSMIIAPVGREGSVREITRTGAFARWQKYEEEDFMAFWYPVIDRCKDMMLDGDWNFSRNSIWEMMRGVLIQSGAVASRPKADMEVFDLDGHAVTLLARTQKLAQTLKYQLGKGFEAREAATALAQIFTIDDDIRTKAIPAKGVKLHPVLKDRSPEELAAMDAIKAELKPILLAHCAHYMRLDDLPAEYRQAATKSKKLSKAQREAFKQFADEISARQDTILSVEPSAETSAKVAHSKPSPQRTFDGHERFFEKRAQAKLFEDDLYGKLSEWERLALPFAIGGTEVGLYPREHPMATMVLTDLKRGSMGFERAQAENVHDMNEFAGAMGRDISEVIKRNTEASEALKAKLKAQNPGKIVVNTPSFLRIADAIEKMRPEGFIAAAGATKTSPAARLALQMKYLDREVDCAVFQEGWEHSNDLVQLRVRSRLIQAGLVERPDGAKSQMRVVSANDLTQPETLLEDITLLTKEVARAAQANVRAPEQAIALARLITLHDLVVDPTLQNSGGTLKRELINPSTADPSLATYDQKEAQKTVAQARELLIRNAAEWIPRERLYAERDASDDGDRAAAKEVQNRRMEVYIRAGETLRSKQSWAKKMTQNNEIETRAKGARQ